MIKQYPILIEPGNSKKAWGIFVPDMPGCYSAADSEEDIIKNAREAISLYLEDANEIPKPSPLASVLAQDKKGKLKIGFIDIDVSKFESPKKRINITLPQNLLDRIDATTNNRSGFLAEAAQEKLAHP